jgi:hypothetical protein
VASDWKRYRRTAIAEMRPYRMGGSLEGVSVSAPDAKWLRECEVHGNAPGGFIARNPANHDDLWYVAQDYAEVNFDLAHPVGDADA